MISDCAVALDPVVGYGGGVAVGSFLCALLASLATPVDGIDIGRIEPVEYFTEADAIGIALAPALGMPVIPVP